ncbi:MAG TPA: terminase, partial [Clostridiales bacterium]|nr:terminase [Clostridiales bacterium]
GDEIIGQELMDWLDILLSFFDDPDIKIDFTDAHKRIKFIETQCKHFEAPFAGKPFILLPFQKAFIESIYIFKIYDEEMQEWVKKHTDNTLVIARKGGKTPLIGSINLAEFFCGPTGTKILCSGNDYEQASLMFDAINNMREESSSLAKATRKNLQGIYFGNPRRKKT